MTVQARRPAWRDGLAVLALILAWLAATAWMRPLMLPDEGRYATVAWEMLRSGDWLTPTLDGLPFFHKPPLFYWITGAALSVLGPSEMAARAASLAGATLGALSLYLFTRRWCGPQAARRALWVLLVQPLFYVGGQFANLDMLVAGCITATILALAHAALCFEQGQPHRRVLLLAYGLAALGVLAKGLIGFVIPSMVVGLWLVLRWRWRTVVALLSLPGLVVFLLVAAPWFVAMQQRFDGFVHYFFVVQHFQRFAADGFNNVQPFWFYPVVVVVCSLPGILWARPLLARGYFTASAPRSEVRWLMVLAVGCVLLFFSLPQSKLVGYILPAVPPLAWLIADASVVSGDSSVRRRWWWATLVLSALLGLAVVVGLALDQRHSRRSLGLALRAQHQPGVPVFMLNTYLYDVPFYARLQEPVHVVDDWSNPEIARRDNWRKEIADAGKFAPDVAARLLLTPEALPQALCRQSVSWVIAAQDQRGRYPFLAQAEAVYTASGETLWRVDSRQGAQFTALNCAGTPNGG
ncbi:ArnT family glycosyltransferase [Acidovorax soli]|uniref:Dolichyl-phosphate-mannose-protein mannosyltransferase n=1 Tax=Acidovorax soli TaxID=592050 RepID=A0A1H4BLS7_9BURK|nr:glycosyltransferase family 39 protein [Acidovorax soli]SEA49113.1 Dolichyl-phosphate-mannose-protein mannosyltransferase [Acidovorax soli]